MDIRGPKYWIAGDMRDGKWTALHYGYSDRDQVTTTSRSSVREFDDEAEYLVALRQALAESDLDDRRFLDCPYEEVVASVLRNQSGCPMTDEERKLAWESELQHIARADSAGAASP